MLVKSFIINIKREQQSQYIGDFYQRSIRRRLATERGEYMTLAISSEPELESIRHSQIGTAPTSSGRSRTAFKMPASELSTGLVRMSIEAQ